MNAKPIVIENKRQPKVLLTVKVEPEQFAKIDQVARILGCNRSKAVRAIVNAIEVGEPWNHVPTQEDVDQEAGYAG